MTIIKKKIWPQYFDAVASGKKRLDLRVADLEEWDPETKQYTGRKIEKAVDFVLNFGLDDFGQGEIIKEKGLFIVQFK